jgi:dTMP kinase
VFITFESTSEALGKSTQIRLLATKLRENGYKVVETFEPGGNTMAGSMYREMLLDKRFQLASKAELLTFFADRAEHYEKVIKPALEQGYILLCDRYFDSSIAYQGYARGHNIEFLFDLHDFATKGTMPDLTFVFDGKPLKEFDKSDTFESQDKDFFDRVKRGMLDIANMYDRCVLINANQKMSDITNQLYDIVIQKLGDSNAAKN